MPRLRLPNIKNKLEYSKFKIPVSNFFGNFQEFLINFILWKNLEIF